MGTPEVVFNQEEFEEWVKEREDELFKKETFKKLGKEHDYIFQILVFMGHASQQMSLANTIASQLEDFPPDIIKEMRDITSRYVDLQEMIRNLPKTPYQWAGSTKGE